MAIPGNIIVFDGYCNFCSGAVLFIIKRDRKARFVFAASQSPVGERIQDDHGIGQLAAHSIVMIEGDMVFERSTAALRILRGLSGLWPICFIFILLPKGIRDWIYDRIAASRYRLFGMREECFVPTQEIRARFINPPPPPIP